MIFEVKHISLFLCLFLLTAVFTQGMTQDGDSQPRPAKALGAVHAHDKTDSIPILVIAPYPEPADSGSMTGEGLLYTPGSAGYLSSRISAAAEAHGISLRKAPEINSPVLNAYMQDYPSSALWIPVKYLHTPSESVFRSDLSALDDRAGCAVLLASMGQLDWRFKCSYPFNRCTG